MKTRLLLAASFVCFIIFLTSCFPCYAAEVATSSSVVLTDVETDEVLSDEDIFELENDFDDWQKINNELDGEIIVDAATLETIVQLLTYITGILIFFMVVMLCKYTYSFFNMFF